MIVRATDSRIMPEASMRRLIATAGTHNWC
jgi:hypothetical protein